MTAPFGTLMADSLEVFAKMDRLHIDLKKAYHFNIVADQRKGQAWFNALSLVAPDLADIIRGTDEDPFHDDTRIPAFMKAIFGNAEFDY